MRKSGWICILVFLVAFSLVLLIGCGRKLRSGTADERYILDFSFDPEVYPFVELSRLTDAASTGDAESIFNLAVQYAKMGNFFSADSAFYAAIDVKSDDAVLLLQVGYYFERHRRDYEAAIELYRRATKLATPIRDMAFYRWGNAILRQGDVEHAGDVFIECYFRERWFNIFAIYNAQGILKGWYSNITTAPEIHSGMIHWRDLALDVLRLPNGREWILDEDEFEALDLPPHERERARKALATIQRWARERRFPFSLH